MSLKRIVKRKMKLGLTSKIIHSLLCRSHQILQSIVRIIRGVATLQITYVFCKSKTFHFTIRSTYILYSDRSYTYILYSYRLIKKKKNNNHFLIVVHSKCHEYKFSRITLKAKSRLYRKLFVDEKQI